MVLRDGRRHVERDGAGVLRHVDGTADGTAGGEHEWPPGSALPLGWGHPRLFLDPPEFGTAIRGPSPVELAGGRAWRITVAAPGAKPYTLHLVVDDATGLLLSYAAEGAGYRCEVLELAVDQSLPPDTFLWDGPVAPAPREVPSPPPQPMPTYWPAIAQWQLEASDDGAVLATLNPALGTAAVHRRVRAAGPPGVDTLLKRLGWPPAPAVRLSSWDSSTFSWILLTPDRISDADLARIRASVA